MEDTLESKEAAHCACLSTDYPVSFAIFALARSHRARAAAMLAEIGLFPGQELLLMRLLEKEGEPQKSLCDSFGLDHSTIAKSLGRLEQQGLIHRHKCVMDGRATNVFLTDKGREATTAILRVWRELERLTIADLSPEEQGALITTAHKIIPQMG
jgi:DNA-binding MarR family transcriptional regulator